MSENLFAYTATNSGYSEGTAGAINGDRAATATALSAVKNKMTGLNGDPAFFNFFDRNSSRLVLRQYNYTSTSEPNQIIDPQAATWSSLVTPIVWSGVANLHGVATSVNGFLVPAMICPKSLWLIWITIILKLANMLFRQISLPLSILMPMAFSTVRR